MNWRNHLNSTVSMDFEARKVFCSGGMSSRFGFSFNQIQTNPQPDGATVFTPEEKRRPAGRVRKAPNATGHKL